MIGTLSWSGLIRITGHDDDVGIFNMLVGWIDGCVFNPDVGCGLFMLPSWIGGWLMSIDSFLDTFGEFGPSLTTLAKVAIISTMARHSRFAFPHQNQKHSR